MAPMAGLAIARNNKPALADCTPTQIRPSPRASAGRRRHRGALGSAGDRRLARAALVFELRADVGSQRHLGDLTELGARQRADEFETFGPLVLGQALSLQVSTDVGEHRRVPR